jgi:hypothetical protein
MNGNDKEKKTNFIAFLHWGSFLEQEKFKRKKHSSLF